MGYAQKLNFLFFFFLLSISRADNDSSWQISVNRMGFFGSYGVGGIYEYKKTHSLELAWGSYLVKKTQYSQINLAYRYAHWQHKFDHGLWMPFQVGLFAVYSLDGQHYFTKSPDKYPYNNYYDQTAIRCGVELGSQMDIWELPISLAYHIRVLDAGLVAIYNNANKDLQYHISSGVSLRYLFQ